MEREELAAIFYGDGERPAVWATDCPIRFDVWYEFARDGSAPRPARRVEVIIAVNEEHGPRRVLEWLSDRETALQAAFQPIAAGGFVSAQLTLEQLMLAAVPLTNLARVAEMAPSASVAANHPPAAGHPPPSAGETILDADNQELLPYGTWLLLLLTDVMLGAAYRPSADGDQALAQARALLGRVPRWEDPAAPPKDDRTPEWDRRRPLPILSVTTNRTASPAVTRSRRTIKADAAEQLFSVDCSAIGWAVVDSGIDAGHPAFADWSPPATPPIAPGSPALAGSPLPPALPPSRVVRAFDFLGHRDAVSVRDRLFRDTSHDGVVDWEEALPYLEMVIPGRAWEGGKRLPGRLRAYAPPVNEHGTHVAGILGGWWPARDFKGVCPTIRLYDFRVLDRTGHGDEFTIVCALQAIRHLNEQAGKLVIAGVNLSLSVPHDVATFSCGWTPICIECERLSRSGVVVVAAAGNSGYYGALSTIGTGYHGISISDPGNADAVITVGSTHRSDPHRHGVSYFSGRGPTADGRAKPDLLAPGEDIDGPVPGNAIEARHGTSQAAAHVSGAAAMLMARHRELLGRTELVKQILCSTATDLGRQRAFQGHGLIDVLRAMQSL